MPLGCCSCAWRQAEVLLRPLVAIPACGTELKCCSAPLLLSLMYGAKVCWHGICVRGYEGFCADNCCARLQASSRCGTPDELKALIDEAHHLGLTVRALGLGSGPPAHLPAHHAATLQQTSEFIVGGHPEATLHVCLCSTDPCCPAWLQPEQHGSVRTRRMPNPCAQCAS